MTRLVSDNTEQNDHDIPSTACIQHWKQNTGTIPTEDDWNQIASIPIAVAHSRSTDHHPQTQVQLCWLPHMLYVHFQVKDQYVVSRVRNRQGQVCTDSCVEAFLQPRPDAGYFNFEVNISGVIHVSYVTDPTRTPTGFAGCQMLTDDQLDQIQIITDTQDPIDPEHTSPMDWQITLGIPMTLFEEYLGPMSLSTQSVWRGNFYKCADKSSHPHWLSWQPVGENLSFHTPQYFGRLCFVDH